MVVIILPLKVIWSKDLAMGSPMPWYLPLDTTHFSLNSFRLTAVGRFFTRNMVNVGPFCLVLDTVYHLIVRHSTCMRMRGIFQIIVALMDG